MVFNLLNNHTVSINYLEFIQTQKKINEKFPNPNKKFINMFDNMVGQIDEEIFECREAIYNNTKEGLYQTSDSLEEFIDIFMYIGSLLCEIGDKLDFNIEDALVKYNLTAIPIEDVYVMNNYYQDDLPSGDWLTWVRRMIYNRKYHKKASNKPDNYEEILIKSIINGGFLSKNQKNNSFTCPIFIGNMNPFLNNVFFCYGDENVDSKRLSMIPDRIKELNSILNKKQSYILSL